MCRKELSEGAKACALKTRFYFDDMRAAARIAAELLPCGKMLLIADEEDSHAALAMRGAFAGLRVFCVVFGAEDTACGLFSLPDDVRIAVGAGAPAAFGALTEDPKSFGKALIFVALGEGIALYGMLIAILIWTKV